MRHAGHLGAAGGAVQPMVFVLMIPRRRVRLMTVRTTLRHRVYMQSPGEESWPLAWGRAHHSDIQLLNKNP